jgi:hypothetical protein
MKHLPLTAAALLALAACQAQPASDSAPDPAGDDQTPAATSSPTPAPSATPQPRPPQFGGLDRPPPLVPEAERGDEGARNVLLYWARALELGNYDRAFDQWGADGEARSGMTRAQHAAYWGRFKTVTIAVPGGEMEGAAGSLYYSVPTTVVGKQQNGTPCRLEGAVTLRRVNDVDGATPDQLRWHLEKVDLREVS